MRTYTSEFLRQLRDKDNFIEPTRTYFPPWWKFWDKKVKTETSFSGDFIREYDQAGKLLVPGKAALTAVAGSIAKYTAALTGDPAQAPGANLFGFIREQLTRQKKVLG